MRICSVECKTNNTVEIYWSLGRAVEPETGDSFIPGASLLFRWCVHKIPGDAEGAVNLAAWFKGARGWNYNVAISRFSSKVSFRFEDRGFAVSPSSFFVFGADNTRRRDNCPTHTAYTP